MECLISPDAIWYPYMFMLLCGMGAACETCAWFTERQWLPGEPCKERNKSKQYGKTCLYIFIYCLISKKLKTGSLANSKFLFWREYFKMTSVSIWEYMNCRSFYNSMFSCVFLWRKEKKETLKAKDFETMRTNLLPLPNGRDASSNRKCNFQSNEWPQ